MDTNDVFVLATVFVGWVVIEIIHYIIIRIKRTSYLNIVVSEMIREHFAKARRQLLDLAINEKIDVNTITFQSLYNIQTLILRRPDRYDVISQMLLDALLEPTPSEIATFLDREAKIWTNEVRNLVLFTSEGLSLIIREYLPISRLLSFAPISLARFLEENWQKLISRFRIVSPIAVIIRAENRMQTLSTASAET